MVVLEVVTPDYWNTTHPPAAGEHLLPATHPRPHSRTSASLQDQPKYNRLMYVIQKAIFCFGNFMFNDPLVQSWTVTLFSHSHLSFLLKYIVTDTLLTCRIYSPGYPPQMRSRMNAPSPVRVPGATSAIPQPSELPRPKTTGIPRPGTSRLQAPKTR